MDSNLRFPNRSVPVFETAVPRCVGLVLTRAGGNRIRTLGPSRYCAGGIKEFAATAAIVADEAAVRAFLARNLASENRASPAAIGPA
jgi:hypothetical protein